jgi:hypothetical protein
METTTKHLWEIEHPYYCATECYFTSESIRTEYASWPEFLEAEGDDDLDMNFVFRWDWNLGEDHGLPVHPDPHYRDGELDIFFMNQRKGYHRVAEIKVCKADEDSVRTWLKSRWEHLKKVWEPFDHESDKR